MELYINMTSYSLSDFFIYRINGTLIIEILKDGLRYMTFTFLNTTSALITIDQVISIENYYKLQTLEKELLLTFKAIDYMRASYADLLIECQDFDILCNIEKWVMAYDLHYQYPDKVKILEIPVCYDTEYALDQKEALTYTELNWNQIINLHSKKLYFVYFLGFTYGFPYLGGMDERLEMPRKETPRIKIPKGSVGIAGLQTGIYPSELPGGWQIIGRTPMALYNISDTVIQPGMMVRFLPISKERFSKYNQEISIQEVEWPLS